MEMGFNQNLGMEGFFWDRDKTEKEKEKKKAQTFLVGSVCVCVCGDRKTKQHWVKEERRGHVREKTNLLTCSGCGLHQKVKKLRTEMWGMVLRYWSQTIFFSVLGFE